jgi:hypothetical protein
MTLEPEAFYTASNLNGNPFRTNPVHGSDPRIGIWVGYEKQRNQLMKFLTRSRADQVGNVNFVMLYGDYGTGKSHALLWALNEITNVKDAEFHSLAYYIPTLKKEKGNLTFAGAFRDDIVEKTSFVKDAWQFRQHLGSTIYRYRDENPEAKDVSEDEVVRRLIPAIELYNLAREILHCDTEESVRFVVAPDKLTDYQAMVIFTRLVNLFVHEIKLKQGPQRYKKAVYLMIDEMDDLIRASAKEARDVNDILRHIYDACPNCFGLAIALSAEVAELPAIFYDYLLERIQRRIVLETLDKNGAVEFVKAILDENRLKPNHHNGYFPFDEAAVDAIAGSLVKITPRKIINTMQQVIEEVRLAGLNPATAIADLSFLDENEILEEVLGDGGLA